MNSIPRTLTCLLIANSSLFAQTTASSEEPKVRVEMRTDGAEAQRSDEPPFTAYPRYYRDTNDLLVRRAEDGTPRTPNPNGSNAGITPGLAKNNYLLRTFALHHVRAIDVQSYLLRSVAYEGGTVEVMGKSGVRDEAGNSVEFVFVTAPDFMLPGIEDTIARIDIQGFTFHDGTGNNDANGLPGCREYIGKHRTAGELRSILIGTELGNVGQFYFSPFADPALNTLYISENPTDIADDIATLERFDRPPLQAEFQLTIYEIDDDDFQDVGVDFDAFKRSLSGTFTLTETSDDGRPLSVHSLLKLDARILADFLDFLVDRSRARLVTRTSLLSINSEDNPGALSNGLKGNATASPAVFRSVRPLPYRILAAEDGPTQSTSVVDSSAFEGISLTIQPFIGSASITAEVAVQVNSLIGFDSDQRIPNIVERASRSVVTLAPGVKHLLGNFEKQTRVESRSGIPLLMDIPWLGGLFRREVVAERTSRLLIFVEPRIVDFSQPSFIDPGAASQARSEP